MIMNLYRPTQANPRSPYDQIVIVSRVWTKMMRDFIEKYFKGLFGPVIIVASSPSVLTYAQIEAQAFLCRTLEEKVRH